MSRPAIRLVAGKKETTPGKFAERGLESSQLASLLRQIDGSQCEGALFVNDGYRV